MLVVAYLILILVIAFAVNNIRMSITRLKANTELPPSEPLTPFPKLSRRNIEEAAMREWEKEFARQTTDHRIAIGDPHTTRYYRALSEEYPKGATFYDYLSVNELRSAEEVNRDFERLMELERRFANNREVRRDV